MTNAFRWHRKTEMEVLDRGAMSAVDVAISSYPNLDVVDVVADGAEAKKSIFGNHDVGDLAPFPN